MPQCFRVLPRLDQFRNWRPAPQWFCNKCYVLANNSVKNVSVTLWFCLQCSRKKCLQPCDSAASMPCTTFCFVCFYWPAFYSVCVHTMDFVSGHKQINLK